MEIDKVHCYLLSALQGLPDGTGGDNSKSADFLPPLRKQLLKRINELKRSELQGATAHQKMLDTLSRQVRLLKLLPYANCALFIHSIVA